MSPMAIPDDISGKRKSDRRVIRTRKAIHEAFENLIKTHRASEISVSELAREADIDRKTFYLHYNGVKDVADLMAKEFLERALEEIMKEAEDKPASERAAISLSVVNNMIMDNLTVFKNIARSFSSGQLETLYMRNIRDALANKGFVIADDEYDHLALRLQFYFSGALSLYVSWLTDDKGMPIETISDAIEEALQSRQIPEYFDAVFSSAKETD